ncbi:MAG: hypothetical protein GKS05_04350 [Nitrospirales bacterium]|nr:hypothetical protein [Nitrospirales bacterium]
MFGGSVGLFLLLSVLLSYGDTGSFFEDNHKKAFRAKVFLDAHDMVAEGQKTFRFDTFGDEAFWGGTLRLHEAIAGKQNGGVGPGVSPNTALAVGLKVDKEALPKSLKRQIKRGNVDLDDPATTLALLKLNAVVGVTGFFDEYGTIQSIGIQCALCHSTVNDSFAPGIGRRLDGWANQDLNVGTIIALAPDLSFFSNLLNLSQDTVRTVLNGWGPGKFDAHLLLDGKNAPTLIPPAFGLAGVNLHTWTGWGSVTHWNAFVAVLEMGGQGTLYEPRLNNEEKFPIATENGFYNVRRKPDLVTKKLPALQFYQLALQAPRAPRGSFDKRAARRGKRVFNKQGKCAGCHVPPIFTEPGWNMHRGEEFGIDNVQAERGPEDAYRTTPLKGLWTHTKRGFFHDGRFPTLLDVVNHYDQTFQLELSSEDKRDLIEYLKSL